MGKHAFLLQVHNNKNQLIKLLTYLDHPKNDIFVHVDAKSSELDGIEQFRTKHSKLIFVQRIRVYWGGYSQIQVEMELLKSAISLGKYDRYHLISGADMPLVTVKELHSFFDKRADTEFIHFDINQDETMISDRVAQYHWLRNRIDRSQRILCGIEKISLVIQKFLGVNRWKNCRYVLRKGANWFSITDDCARYICSQSEWVDAHFKYTKCCDEVFLQTLVYNSKFKDHLYPKTEEFIYENMRLTDWKRGNPYTFKSDDIELLFSSGYIFARKFDEKVDANVIDEIYNKLSNVNSEGD